MTNFKPCPFCGKSETEVMDYPLKALGLPPINVVRCTNCGAQGEPFATEAIAIEKWNGRHEELEDNDKLTPNELAGAHWKYVESVIRAEWEAFESAGFGTGNIDAHCDLLRHHYTTAFVHGFKHGRETP